MGEIPKKSVDTSSAEKAPGDNPQVGIENEAERQQKARERNERERLAEQIESKADASEYQAVETKTDPASEATTEQPVAPLTIGGVNVTQGIDKTVGKFSKFTEWLSQKLGIFKPHGEKLSSTYASVRDQLVMSFGQSVPALLNLPLGIGAFFGSIFKGPRIDFYKAISDAKIDISGWTKEQFSKFFKLNPPTMVTDWKAYLLKVTQKAGPGKAITFDAFNQVAVKVREELAGTPVAPVAAPATQVAAAPAAAPAAPTTPAAPGAAPSEAPTKTV